MRVVISGYYGFGNAGDEASLRGIVEGLRARDPQVQVAVISADPQRTRAEHGIEAVFRGDMAGVVRAVAGADLVLSGGGSLLQDSTSRRSLLYYLGVIALARYLRVPVAVYAQGVGPLEEPADRVLTRWALSRVQCIAVRDEESRAELLSLGVAGVAVEVTADAALALAPPDPGRGRTMLLRQGLGEGPWAGLALRPWPGGERWKRELAAFADALQERLGLRVVYLPFQDPGDVWACREVASLQERPGRVLGVTGGAVDLLDVVAALDLLVGVRLHSLIFAAMGAVPFLGLSYDPKVDRFLRSVGRRAVAPLVDADAAVLEAAAREVLARREEIGAELGARRGELRRLALRTADLALAAGRRP